MPRVMAATAGAKTERATPESTCPAMTGPKSGNSGRSSEVAVTKAAAMIISPRLKRVRSMSAPMGVCETTATTPATAMTAPIEASSHLWVTSR